MTNKLKTFAVVAIVALAATFTACDKGGDDGDKQIVLPDKTEGTQQAFADDETTGGFTFTAKAAWTATVTETTASRASNVSWLRLFYGGEEKYSGGAGTFTLVIEIDENYTGATRTATITITSGTDNITVTVTQDDKTGEGEVHEPPRVITAITETGTINSGMYGAGNPYRPLAFEFKYYAANYRLKELHIKDPQNEYGNYVYTYDYSTLNEIRVSDNYGERYTGTLNNMGYVSSIAPQSSPAAPVTLTYDANGYIKTVNDGTDSYTYIWQNGNIVGVEGEDSGEVSYTAELNDKTNIDLNAFMMNVADGNLSYNPEGLFMLIDRVGKRMRNYIVFGGDDAWDYPVSRNDPYTESSLPAVGTVFGTVYESEASGEPSWSFDAGGFPTAYTWKKSVVKVESVYNGNKQSATPRDENERQKWTSLYGLGPWWYITLEAKTYPAVIDTYKYTFTYDK